MSKELDDAAENYLRETVEGWDCIPAIPSYDMDVFKAGAYWGIYESEEVRALIRALKTIAYGPNDICNSVEECPEIAVAALRAFNSQKIGEAIKALDGKVARNEDEV